MKNLIIFLKKEFEDYKILFRNIPSPVVTIFVLSVVCANLMANKELINYKYIALDCGFAFSWVMFLCMDMICKRWGAKASVKISLYALSLNLLVCASFFILSQTSGNWGEFYTALEHSSQTGSTVNNALNKTFGGSWYIVLGSSLAFLISSIINALLNKKIGLLLKKDNFTSFAIRSYVSTFIAQFVDNLTFATVVSKVFFGWTWTQIFACSIVAACFELFCEVIFSKLGYKITKDWQKENVGQEYIDLQK